VLAPTPTPVERALSATPSNSLLVSNAPYYAYLATGHAALVMPSAVDYLTGYPDHAFQQDLRELADTLRQHGGYVFWKQSLDPIATPEQLAAHVHLRLIAGEPIRSPLSGPRRLDARPASRPSVGTSIARFGEAAFGAFRVHDGLADES
jgi:hypothetical protein